MSLSLSSTSPPTSAASLKTLKLKMGWDLKKCWLHPKEIVDYIQNIILNGKFSFSYNRRTNVVANNWQKWGAGSGLLMKRATWCMAMCMTHKIAYNLWGPFLMSLEHKYFQRFSFPKRKWKWLSSIARSTWQSPRGPWQGCPPHRLPASKATCSPPPSSPPPQGLWDQGCPDPPSPGSPPISQLCRSLSEIFSSRNAPRNGSASWAAGEHGRSLEHCGLMLVCPCRGSRSAGLSPRAPFGPVMKIASYVKVRVCRSIFEIQPGPPGDVHRHPSQSWLSENSPAPPCPRGRARARGLNFASRGGRSLPWHRPDGIPGGFTSIRNSFENLGLKSGMDDFTPKFQEQEWIFENCTHPAITRQHIYNA